MNEDQSSDQAEIQRPLRELAEEVLRNEKAAPGSQDPEFVRWASDKLSGKATTTPTPTPTAFAQPQAPQPAGSSLAEDHEGVLQIRQMPGQTIRPTEGNKPNDGQGTA